MHATLFLIRIEYPPCEETDQIKGTKLSWNYFFPGKPTFSVYRFQKALSLKKITLTNSAFRAWISNNICINFVYIQYILRSMHTVFALLCFVVIKHWLIFLYPSGLLHWHCGNLTIATVPAKQPWWIWINTSFEFIMNDYITTTKQSTTKPCAYFLGYTVSSQPRQLKLVHGWVIISHRKLSSMTLSKFKCELCAKQKGHDIHCCWVDTPT